MSPERRASLVRQAVGLAVVGSALSVLALSRVLPSLGLPSFTGTIVFVLALFVLASAAIAVAELLGLIHRVRRDPPLEPVQPVQPVQALLLQPESPDTAYVVDYALGRLEVLADGVREDARKPAPERESQASEEHLAAVVRHLEAAREGVLAGEYEIGRRQMAEACRMIGDQWPFDSRLARDILASGRNLFGPQAGG